MREWHAALAYVPFRHVPIPSSRLLVFLARDMDLRWDVGNLIRPVQARGSASQGASKVTPAEPRMIFKVEEQLEMQAEAEDPQYTATLVSWLQSYTGLGLAHIRTGSFPVQKGKRKEFTL